MQKKKIFRAAQMCHHIEACQVGGMYVEQNCKEQNLNPATYYYWRKKLSEDSKESNESLSWVRLFSEPGFRR
jgi:transposase-like protein